MTVLTWRDVATPDFRGAMDGLEVASKSLNAGLSAARGGLDDIEKRQHDNQSTALLAELAKYQDPAALQADLASGAFQSRFDMSKLHPDDLKTVMSRPGEILAFAKEKTGYDQTLKAVADNDRFRALEPVVNEYRQLAQDDPSGTKAAEFRSTHPELRNMSTSDFNALLNTSLRASQDQFGHGKDVTGFAQSQEDRDTGLKASSLDGFLTGIVEKGDRLRYINTNRKELDAKYGARAVDMILRQADEAFGAPAGSAGGTGGAGATGGDIYNVVLGNGQYGTPPQPLTQMTIGQVIDFGRNTLIPNSKAAGVGRDSRGLVGSSASGAYQITQETLQRYAPRVLGANWQSQIFSPEVQDKLAEAIFNDSKSGNLKAVWASLPDSRPGAYAGKSWADMKGIITQGESGGVANPRSLQIAGNVVNQVNNTSDLAQGAIKFQELKNDNSQARAVAQRMTGKDGLFAGQDIGNMTQKIQEISREYKINAAMAGFLIEKADNGNKNWLGRQFTWAPGNDGLTVDIDSDQVRELAKAYSDPKTLADATISVDASNRAQQANAQAQAQVDALVAQRTAIVQRAAQRGIKPDTSLVDQQLAAALGQRDATAINGAVTAASGQTARTGQDGVPPPKPVARRPAVRTNQAPLILASKAQDQSNAPWAKKALAKVKAGSKKLTPEEFTAAIAASGRKSLLTR